MIKMIESRLQRYQVEHDIGEENALKEVVQEIVLYGLWQAGFFEEAAFQGGTSLRILHGLNRFSEDLDFILKAPSSQFNWAPYLESLMACLNRFGVEPEVLEKGRMDQRIRKALLKDRSIAQQLNINLGGGRRERKLKLNNHQLKLVG